MVTSKTKTVDDYIAEQPEARAEVLKKIRSLIKKNLSKGFEENMTWGMPTYEIPLSRYPDTYNKKPLAYVGFAAQKNFYAIYLMCANTDSKQENMLQVAYSKAGKKLDMGKCCLRFKKLDDLLVEPVAAIIASMSVSDYIKVYEASRR